MCDQKVFDVCDSGRWGSSALLRGSVCALHFDLTDRYGSTNTSSSDMPMLNVKEGLIIRINTARSMIIIDQQQALFKTRRNRRWGRHNVQPYPVVSKSRTRKLSLKYRTLNTM